jgi:hypothetical protein
MLHGLHPIRALDHESHQEVQPKCPWKVFQFVYKNAVEHTIKHKHTRTAMAAIATARGTTVQTVKPNNPTVSRHIPYLATYLILRIIQTCFAITVIGLSANLLAIDAKHHGHYAPGQFLNLYTPSPSVKHGFKLSAPLAMLLLGVSLLTRHSNFNYMANETRRQSSHS